MTTNTLILLSINDLIVIGDNSMAIQHLISQLLDTFKMIKLKKATIYLGAQKQGNAYEILLHEETYVNKLLCKFDMAHCNLARTPKSSNIQFQANMNQKLVNRHMLLYDNTNIW